MTPVFVDVFLSACPEKLALKDIDCIGVGVPDGGDLSVTVVMQDDFADREDPELAMLAKFRDKVVSAGGTPVGRARSPMLGATLVGFNIRSVAWPALSLALLRHDMPLYNFAAPLSRRWNDSEMADLRNVFTQANWCDEKDELSFGDLLSAVGVPGTRIGPPSAGESPSEVREMMLNRITAMADVYAKYCAFSGKE